MENRSRTILFLCTANYYRSRYAEAIFNHLAPSLAPGWRAASAGLMAEYYVDSNPGNISPHTVGALARAGIALADPVRRPLQLTIAEIESASHTIALCRREHEPMVLRLFPTHVDRILYWEVEDISYEHPEMATQRIEQQVRALLESLKQAG